MMSLWDRQTVAWVPVQLEQRGVPPSNPDPLCYPSKHTHTHPPVYSIPILLQTALRPHFRPLFLLSPRPTAPPDMQGTLIIPLPIINPCCLHTMGPKESFRHQRKHLLLSRQGTNSRILEAVSYIPSVKNTHTQTYAHIHSMYVQTCRQLLPPALPLSLSLLSYMYHITCKSAVKFLRQRQEANQT